MTADPWLTPTITHEPLLTMEEWEAIQGDVYDSPWNDPQRFPECLKVAMEALRRIALGDVHTFQVEATQALRRIVQRSVSGVPFGEPAAEPEWALIPEERHVPGSERR